MTTPASPPPPGHTDWPTLAATAARIFKDRDAGDPKLVENHKLTTSQAEYRLATARALALQWQAVMAHEDVPLDDFAYFEAFGAWPFTVRLEIADIARLAADRARADAADEAKALLAGACAALAWYQQPHGFVGDTPLILRVHAANQQARADRAARPVQAPARTSAPAPRRLAGSLL
jgi:hypothetical protein